MATGEESIFQCARDVLWVILEQPSPSIEDLANVWIGLPSPMQTRLQVNSLITPRNDPHRT